MKLSTNPQDCVLVFHETYGLPVGTSPHLLDDHRANLRFGLIDEEYGELANAVDSYDIIETADALGDLVYVCYGMAIEMGIDLNKIIEAIQVSNLSKLDDDHKPIYRADGKVLKGPNFQQPKILEALQEQGYVPVVILRGINEA